MGKRGPKKTPTRILKLRGSERIYRRKREPEPPVTAPEMPDWLPKRARDEWKRRLPQLLAQGIVTELDQIALALYCHAYDEFLEADEICRKLTLIVTTKKGNVIQNPALAIRSNAFKRLQKIAAEFGMTPAGRAGVKVAKPNEREDAAESFLSRNRKSS